MMVIILCGRLLPSFTRNGLNKSRRTGLCSVITFGDAIKTAKLPQKARERIDADLAAAGL